jgi:hypothetical protein
MQWHASGSELRSGFSVWGQPTAPLLSTPSPRDWQHDGGAEAALSLSAQATVRKRTGFDA